MAFKKNLIFRLWGFYTDLLRRQHKLRYIHLEITQKCNFSCRHCGSDCRKSKVKNEITTEEIKKVFTEIAKTYLKKPKTIAVSFTGGEPLVREDVYEIGAFLNKLGYYWGLVTNGWLLNKGNIDKLVDAKIGSIGVSIDGFKENHEWLRNKEGSFKKAVDGLCLINGRIPIAEAMTVVHRKNYKELPALGKFLKNLGIKYWRILPLSPLGRALDLNIFLNKEEYIQVLNFIVDWRKKHKDILLDHDCEGFFGYKYEEKIRDTGIFFCRAGINVAGIGHLGEIETCPDIPESFVQGNIRKDNFIDIWENKFEIFRKPKLRKKGMCANCKQFFVCKGGPTHLWENPTSGPKFCSYKLLKGEKNG